MRLNHMETAPQRYSECRRLPYLLRARIFRLIFPCLSCARYVFQRGAKGQLISSTAGCGIFKSDVFTL